MTAAKKETNTFKDAITSYFKGVKIEWGKIVWPEKKQVVAQTFIVLLIVLFFMTLTYVMDLSFKGILDFIPKMLGITH